MNGGRNLLGLRPLFSVYEHQFCAKRFFNLPASDFRSPENDFPFCGKRFSR